ncbi:MAG: hypothetical protein DMF84_13565 [Acidobacteria bacterium]|nr:MAG: hypothetical protein DMF84_13565 [Acidobacteriota bacterium]
MTSISAKAVGRAIAVVLLGALTVTMPASRAQSSNTVNGGAYGAFVQTPAASLARSPFATLDPSGMGDAAAAAVNVASVLAAESLSSVTTGVVGENAASAQSGSTLQNVNILGGLITAQLVSGQSSSASNGSSASSDANGSTFAGLLVGSVAIADGVPAPNSQIALPGVGTVTLNEQIPRGDGQTTSGLTVNMIHVRLKDVLTGAQTGEIIVGAADSDAAFGR